MKKRVSVYPAKIIAIEVIIWATFFLVSCGENSREVAELQPVDEAVTNADPTVKSGKNSGDKAPPQEKNKTDGGSQAPEKQSPVADAESPLKSPEPGADGGGSPEHQRIVSDGAKTPSTDNLYEALTKGIFPEEIDAVEIVAEIRRRKNVFVLYRVPGIEHYLAAKQKSHGKAAADSVRKSLPRNPTGGRRSEYLRIRPSYGELDEPDEGYLIAAMARSPRWAYWLAKLDRRTERPADDEQEPVEIYKRLEMLRLYDMAMSPEDVIGEVDCEVESEIRAGDIDGDGEIEVTAIIGAGAVRFTPDSGEFECGAVAFIVGADMKIQARFTREYKFARFQASIEDTESRATTWRLKDINGDGHSDLHVAERIKSRNYFMGDFVGDGTMPGSDDRDFVTKRADCLYNKATDIWDCPESPRLGQILFRSPAQLLKLRSVKRD